MALTATAVDLQIVITTTGNDPTAGDITQGGLAIITDGTTITGLATSSDGSNIIKMSAPTAQPKVQTY